MAEALMAAQALRLSTYQTLRALDEIDLLDLVAERLTSRERAAVASAQGAAVAGGPGRFSGETALEDLGTGAVALLPTATLRMIWAAGLAVLASRVLVTPGVTTAAIFGSGPALGLQVRMLVRHLPTLGHITVPCPLSDPLTPEDQSVLAQLEREGIGSSTVPDSRRAAHGANLLVITASDRRVPDIGVPVPGASLINAAGQDLSRHVLKTADRVYVDDLRLLDANQHRQFVRMHMAGPDKGARPLLRHREGWYRHPEAGRRWHHVEADLGDVLTCSDPGRTDDEEVLLAELLRTEEIDVALGWRLWRSAAEHGLGGWVDRSTGCG